MIGDFKFAPAYVADLTKAITGYATDRPSLTLGGVGVLPIHDSEDRHVLETAWSGRADILTTADLRGFVDAHGSSGSLPRLSIPASRQAACCRPSVRDRRVAEG